LSPSSARVCLGVIVGAKGLRGEVRIKSFTERPADVAAYGPVTTDDGRELSVAVTGAAQGVLVGRIKGVADRSAAEALRGVKLYVARAALPKTDDGTYYHADLVGMAAELATGEGLGEVTAVYNFGAGDMIEVRRASGQTDLVPFTDAAIAKIDTSSGKIVVNPLPGMFESDSDAVERSKEQDG
jgi:16S rRNA processing protein RimM